MCLGVPMRIVEIDGFNARCEARGIERQASLFLLQHENIQVGDMVMIHVGNAIQKMSEEEALSAWELYDEMLAMEDAVADLNQDRFAAVKGALFRESGKTLPFYLNGGRSSASLIREEGEACEEVETFSIDDLT